MAGYAELRGGRAWYDERGRGEPLIPLHGGAVDSCFFDQNIGAFAERFRVITTDLWGSRAHAGPGGPFSLESFASDVGELIERVVGGPAHVLGHSYGSAVGLTLTMRSSRPRPELVHISGSPYEQRPH